MEWHQEAMAQLIEDFLLGKFSGRGLPPKKWRDWMYGFIHFYTVLYGFIRFYMGLYGFIWCTMMLYGLKKNNEIGMSEWDIPLVMTRGGKLSQLNGVLILIGKSSK